ncbi:MAG: hypothetical protein R3D00_30890 [Bacteroidia bacterium]
MKSSNAIARLFLSAVFAMLIAFLPANTASAHVPVMKTDGIQSSFGEQKIIIKIIIIIKRKAAGVAEITGLRMAGKSQSLENNEILAEAYTENGQLYLRALQGEALSAKILMPDGFLINQAIGLKLGEKGAFKVKGGRFEPIVNKMGNFEIQD